LDQHFIPASYLKAWCDPETPPKQEPYVWVFDKESRSGKRRAPSNLFFEPEFYTVPGEEGGQDLVFENFLGRIEKGFSELRRNKLSQLLSLSNQDRVILCAFCATMHRRTRAQREHTRKQWSAFLETGNKLAEWAKTASPEQLRFLTPPRPSRQDATRTTRSLEDVRRTVDFPVQANIAENYFPEATMLCQMDMAILCASDDIGFITSDHPCIWFDPARPDLPPGLGSETIEISLPLSPAQLLLLNWKGISDYISIPQSWVDKVNRMQRSCCDRQYIVRRNLAHPHWFPDEESDDEAAPPNDC